MERRSFLRMIGAAVAAPLMPLPTLGTAAVAPYSSASLHAAIIHAQTRVSFSVWGLAKTLGVSSAQAEVLMGDLAKRGILGPVQGTTFGGRWASSNILRREALGVAKTAHKLGTQTRHTLNQNATGADLSKLLAHVRKICQSHGMTLHPRCAV
jgi:hypothetical protein